MKPKQYFVAHCHQPNSFLIQQLRPIINFSIHFLSPIQLIPRDAKLFAIIFQNTGKLLPLHLDEQGFKPW